MAMLQKCACCGLLLLGGIAWGQTNSQANPVSSADRSAAYYHYALGHFYEDSAQNTGNRGDYINRAIENLQQAIKEDPNATIVSEELSDLYVQSGKLQAGVAAAEESLRQNPNDLNARRILGRIYTRLSGDTQQGRPNPEYIKKAIDQYQRITERDPKDTESWLMLGRLYSVNSQSPDAEKAYQHVLSSDPNNEEALSGLAMVYLGIGDSKRATELLQRLAAKNPSLRTLTALASTYEQMHDYKLAAETLRRAMEIDSQNLELKKAYALDLLYGDQLAESQKVYQQIVAEDPKDAASYLHLSQIYRQQREFAKADEAIQRAKQLEPDDLDILYNQATLLEAEGKTSQAIDQFKSLLDATAKKSYSASEKANRVRFLEQLGLLYRESEQYPQAVAVFHQIGDLDPELNNRAEVLIVDTYRSARDYSKALAEAEAALKKAPNDRLLHGVHASTLADAGHTDQAIAETKKLLNGKNDREVYLELAQLYDRAKDFPAEAKAIDSAESLSKTPEDRINVIFARGAMLEKQKKYDAAEAEFRKVLAQDANNASALNYLGYMLAERGVRLGEAQQLVSKALELDPGNGAYLDSLGWVYYQQGKLTEAQRYLRDAVEKTPKDPTVHDHLGDAYFKDGKLKEAIDQWQSSLKFYEASSPAEREGVDSAQIQRKLESARVRLAREGGNGVSPKQR